MTHQTGRRQNVVSALLPVATAGLATGVFIADTATQTDIAVAVLYVGVVLMAARRCRPRSVVPVALGCVGLREVSYFLSPPGGPESEGIVNTLISISAIGLTTVLVLQSHLTEVTLREQARLLDLRRAVRFSVHATGGGGAGGARSVDFVGEIERESGLIRLGPEVVDADLRRHDEEGSWCPARVVRFQSS